VVPEKKKKKRKSHDHDFKRHILEALAGIWEGGLGMVEHYWNANMVWNGG